MHTLYHSLVTRFPQQLEPVRCSSSTVAQLQSVFEEVALESGLAPLVVECFTRVAEWSNRELAMIRDLAQAGKVFVFLPTEDAPADRQPIPGPPNEGPLVLQGFDSESHQDRLVVIADAQFSALLVSTANPDYGSDGQGNLVVWSFDPEIVSSALQTLIARVSSADSPRTSTFAAAVSASMPSAAPSAQLTSRITTKLARLLQEQAEREVAVGLVATAIRSELKLNRILVTAAHEVGRALNVKCCAVQVEGHLVAETLTRYYFRSRPLVDHATKRELLADIELLKLTFARSASTWVVDSVDSQDEKVCAKAAAPLTYQGNYVGLLLVHADNGSRIWADNELQLLHTVADQLTVAVNQAHMQEQALTDGLTGCYNRRSFELQLQRELHLATRIRQPLSLIMIDLDNFKRINDRAGHDTGDVALRIVAESLRAELRAVDSAARFGGDEFAVILPQAGAEGALVVAERLRKKILETEVPGFGFITASFGLATFPLHASSRDTLVIAADRALYNSKHTGRNRVSVPIEGASEPTPVRLINSDPELELEIADTLLRL